MSQSKYWTLTLNNYSNEEETLWQTAVSSGKATYLCYQQEIAPTNGTPHLQGYAVFPKLLRLTGVKKILGTRIHAVLSNGSPSSNRAYCSKEGGVNFSEFGDIPADPKRGKRTDFERFQTAVSEGLRCKRKAREEYPDLVAKYPRWCYDILADQKELKVEEHPLREWQQDLADRLSEPPDDRKIIFVVDPTGNTGKTWFAKHYTKYNDDAQFMEPSKKADMAYALQDTLRVLFINVTRTSDTANLDYLYSFVESVKDGMVFSPKYESRMKYYDKVHVVIMMNMEPNMDLLSHDRYDVIELINK